MNRFVINSAVLTNTGLFHYKKIGTAEAAEWLAKGGFHSTIGYQETANAFEALFGLKLNINRRQISMSTGDEALVFRITKRLDDPSLKGNLSKEFVLQNLEMGLITKVSGRSLKELLEDAAKVSEAVRKDLDNINKFITEVKEDLK